MKRHPFRRRAVIWLLNAMAYLFFIVALACGTSCLSGLLAMVFPMFRVPGYDHPTLAAVAFALCSLNAFAAFCFSAAADYLES